MPPGIVDTLRIVYSVDVADKGTKQLLQSERQVRKDVVATTREFAKQDAALKRSASVAKQAAEARTVASKKATAAIREEQRQIALLTRQNERLTVAARRAEQKAARRGPGVTSSVGGIASTARSNVAFGAGIAGAVGVSQTIKFDRALRNVNSIAGLTEKQLQKMGKQILALAPATAQGPETLAKAMYDLVSSGFDAHQAMQVLDKSARAATAGLTTTEVSTKAVAAILNAYHRPVKDAANISDTLFQTVNRGVISFEQLSNTIGDVLPYSASLGISLNEVGAAVSTMTKGGISPEETMTRIKNVMVKMIKPGDDLQAAFEQLGVKSGEALIKQKGFQGALEAVINTTDGSKAAVAGLFRDIRAISGALALTGKNTKSANQDLRAFKDVNGATSKALKEQQKSTSYQWEQTKAQAQALGITVGQGLLPKLNSAMKTFREMPGPVKIAGAALAATALTIGPLNRLRKNVMELGSSIVTVAKKAAGSKLATKLADSLKSGAGSISGAGRKAGQTAATNAAEGMADQMPKSLNARRGRFVSSFKTAGRLAGRAFGIAAAAVAIYEIADRLNKGGINETGSKDYGSGIVGTVLRGLSKIGNAPINLGGKVLGIKPKRRGGVVEQLRGYQDGGLVPIAAAGGELMVHGGAATMIGGDPGRDGTMVMAPVGAAILTADGQARMAMGASLSEAVRSQAPHFAKGGVVTGKYVSTAYGPPWGGIQGTGTTATGVNLSKGPKVYGIAVDPSLIPLGSQVFARPNPFNRSGPFRAFDTGGAIKGRRIDFYDWRGRKRQNAWGRRPVTITRGAGGPAPATNDEDVVAHVPLRAGASRTRAGLIDDAVAQGVAAGQEGLTRNEIARANAGRRGARVNPIMESIRAAMTPTTREVTIPGASPSSSSGKGLPSGAYVPQTTWNPRSRPIARWIVPYLNYGSSHGWRGTVTSGYRSNAEQTRIYASGVRPAAKPGTSNHEGTTYPRGAVDVTQAQALAAALKRKPGPHLLQYAGAKDPVHFSHPHGGSYRTGGIVGGKLGAAFTAARSFKGGSFAALDAAIGNAIGTRLDALRAQIVRIVRAGGDKKTIQRLQSVIDLIDFELGRRIGRMEDVVEQRTARIDRTAGAADRALRLAGIDPGSTRGLGLMGAVQAGESKTRAQNVRTLQNALKVAQRTGNRTVIREVQDRLREAQDALSESLVKQVETWRDQIRALAQEAIDRAQFTLGLAGAGASLLEAGQRMAGTSNTPGAMAARATFQATTVIPALQAQVEASKFAAQMAAGIGDVNGFRTAVQDAMSATVDLANAQADAMELMRQAAEQAAQDVVDAASSRRSFADMGLERLDLEQQLVGTHDTASGAQGRADFIRATIIPAIQGEIVALMAQQATAQATGNAELARQIGEAIYDKQNDVLREQVDALNQIKGNTDALKDFGGSSAFSYQSQTFTDLDAIRARVGA